MNIIDVQRILVPLFTFIWWRRLRFVDAEHYYFPSHVKKVIGWKTAILIGRSGETTMTTFLFKWEEKGIRKYYEHS